MVSLCCRVLPGRWYSRSFGGAAVGKAGIRIIAGRATKAVALSGDVLSGLGSSGDERNRHMLAVGIVAGL